MHTAGALAFGADDVFFVGDIQAGAIHVFALQDTDFDLQRDVELGNFRTLRI
ncbi:hypothetical protein [Rhizobium hainanense]|uniref:hypothetical protein n=1 Tax=Rhizobium hainanense TaxID=52131 RepID=UPI0013566C9D|nr:hypothetical protein [Rhizobium hainanense]